METKIRREQPKHHIQTHRTRKRLNAKSEKNTKQAGKWYVFCSIHGSKDRTSRYYQQVAVGTPRNKRERYRGCPIC